MSHHLKPGKNKSRVNVVHNVAKGPSVNVLVDGNKVLKNVDYKTQSGYLELPSGKHSVAIKSGNNILASSDVVLDPKQDYTVVAHGDVNNLSSIDLLPLKDNNTCPTKGKSHVRFVHAAAGAPAVDVWAGNSTRIFENVSYGETGNPTYLPVDSGVVEISVTPAGTTQRVLGPLGLNLEQGKVYTITASGIPGDNEAPLTALINEDKRCTTVSYNKHKKTKDHHHHHHHYYYHGDGSKGNKMMPLWMNM